MNVESESIFVRTAFDSQTRPIDFHINHKPAETVRDKEEHWMVPPEAQKVS